eukprot:scaffold62951_cov17-Tisochrysis_lutea.AAC.1
MPISCYSALAETPSHHLSRLVSITRHILPTAAAAPVCLDSVQLGAQLQGGWATARQHTRGASHSGALAHTQPPSLHSPC